MNVSVERRRKSAPRMRLILPAEQIVRIGQLHAETGGALDQARRGG